MNKFLDKITSDFRLLILFAIALTLVLSLLFGGCTKNQRTRFFGAQQEIDLPPNQKLIDAHFDDEGLWTLTVDMDSTDTPKTKYLTKQSSFFKGKVIFHEHRK